MNLDLNITFGGVPVYLIISPLFLIVSNFTLVKNGTEIADITNGKFPIQFCCLLGLRFSSLGTQLVHVALK